MSASMEANVVGSTQWLLSEVTCVKDLVDSTFEDFFYAARDELNWLDSRVVKILDDHPTYQTTEAASVPALETAKLPGSPLKNQVTLTPTSADKENLNPADSSIRGINSNTTPARTAQPSNLVSSASSTIKRQAALSAVAEFNSDPVHVSSSSSVIGDEYVDGDFFGAREREILALEPGDDGLIHKNELSASIEAVDDEYESVASELETSIHYENNEEHMQIRLSGTTEAKTAHAERDREDHTSPSSPNASVHTISRPPCSPAFKSQDAQSVTSAPLNSTIGSSPSQHISFYSANEDEPADIEAEAVTGPIKPALSSSPAVLSAIGRLPIAQSTPTNQSLVSIRSSQSFSTTSRNDQSEVTFSPEISPFRIQNSSPRQLYPTVPSPRGARSPLHHITAVSPTTPRHTPQPRVPIATPLETTPSQAVAESVPAFATLPSKAPLTTKTSIYKKLSSDSGTESSLSSRKTSTTSLSISNNSVENDRQEESKQVSETNTPKAFPSDFAMSLTKADLQHDQEAGTAHQADTAPVLGSAVKATLLLPSYKGFQHQIEEPQDDEEDWVPLSKTTPAPRSRFMIESMSFQAADGNGTTQAKTSTGSILEEEEETDAEAELEKLKKDKTVRPVTSKGQLKSATEPSTKGYFASTAASRSRLPASPVKAVNAQSPTRQIELPARRPLSPTKPRSPVRPYSARPVSPVRAQSPLRKAVLTHVSPDSTAKPDERALVSPARSASTLIRLNGKDQAASANIIAAVTAAHATSRSPVTSAFKNMKSSTADVFRKAKLLLFDQQETEKPKHGKLNLSPSKKASKELLRASDTIYPDLTAALSLNNNGSPGRSIRNDDHLASNENPAKVLFPAHGPTLSGGNLRLGQAQVQPERSQISTSSTESQATIESGIQKTSVGEVKKSADIHFSPDVQGSKSVSTSSADATAAPNVATANVASTGTSIRTSLSHPTQIKRTKSAIRKPPARSKQAPVVVRVPMGAQRELEQQRKAAVAAMSQISPPEVEVATDEKKNDQKREIERRRLENTRRAEDEERRKVHMRSSRVPQTRGPFSRPEEEKPGKRNFVAEGEARMKSMLAPNEQPKRRRTDELTGSPLENKLATSTTRKDVNLKTQQPNLVKAAVTHQGRNIPVVEGVKFSNDKIRFGGEVNVASSVARINGTLPSTTPGTQNSNSQSSQVRLSELTQISVASGDHIALPEIYSESEDDDDGSVILDWAHSPYLQQTLRQQQQVDPDTVFGPVPPLLMEEVFRSRTGIATTRFRPRSSSANWSNQDRLTPQEIEAYAAEMGYRQDSH